MVPTDGSHWTVCNALIETCRDAEGGFRSAAQMTESTALRMVFQTYVQQRELFEDALQEELRRMDKGPTIPASVHRGWLEIKTLREGASVDSILTACAYGEEMSMKNYEEALQSGLPPDLHRLVESQYRRIAAARHRLCSLHGVRPTSRQVHGMGDVDDRGLSRHEGRPDGNGIKELTAVGP